MLSNPMLDVAIGLVFIYLLLSIIVTALQEFLSSFLKLRNKNLQKAMIELLGSDNRKLFYTHPLISPLFRGEVGPDGRPLKGGPAYIPKRNFALAVLDLHGRGLAKAGPAFELAKFFEDANSGVGLSTRVAKFGATADNVFDKISNQIVKTAAKTALEAAVGELKSSADVLDNAINELENLFDSTMNRASGWFKVNAQRIAFGIGLVVAGLLNVDTIYIAQQLWTNEDLRARAVAAAEAYYTTEGQRDLNELCRVEVTGQPVAAATGGAAPPLDQQTWQKVRECVGREIGEATDQIEKAGYPIGWTGWRSSSGFSSWLPEGQPGQDGSWAILGILLTAVALSLGASFWFDLLGKFMNVRMTGKREQTSSADDSNRPRP